MVEVRQYGRAPYKQITIRDAPLTTKPASAVVTPIAKQISMKAIKKLAHKVEAAGLDLGEGISRISKNMGPGSNKQKSKDGSGPSALPPQITRTPTFARVLDDAFSRPSQLGDDDDEGGDSTPWWQQEEGADYIAIFIRDAKDLAVLDNDTRSAST